MNCRRLQFNSWVGKIRWRRKRLPTPLFLVFPCGSAGKESAHNAEDLGSIPGLGRSHGEGNSYPLQYSGLENSMDYIVQGFTKNRICGTIKLPEENVCSKFLIIGLDDEILDLHHMERDKKEQSTSRLHQTKSFWITKKLHK